VIKLLKLKIGEVTQLKDIHQRFVTNGYELFEVGMELINFEDLDLSSDLDFYNFVAYQKGRRLIRVDFDVIKSDLFDWQNWVVSLIDVDFKILRKGRTEN
jgi:hypothetical protein